MALREDDVERARAYVARAIAAAPNPALAAVNAGNLLLLDEGLPAPDALRLAEEALGRRPGLPGVAAERFVVDHVPACAPAQLVKPGRAVVTPAVRDKLRDKLLVRRLPVSPRDSPGASSYCSFAVRSSLTILPGSGR